MAPSSLSRSRTPGRTPAPENADSPQMLPEDSRGRETAQRRPSFSFLRRGKSSERTMSMRSISGGKLTKKQAREAETRREREVASSSQQPPKIPDLPRPACLQTFGGENAKPGRYATIAEQMTAHSGGQTIPSGSVDMTRANIPPIPPIPGDKNGGYVDPYARTESMTNRGRYSYASSAVSTINSPRRVRRRKDPTPFNVLVVGARNSGKTCFIDLLRASLALPARKQRYPVRSDSLNGPTHFHMNPSYVSHYLETETDDGERIGLTLWDSEGLDKNVVDLQLREMSSFLESKFEDTFNEEMKVVRSPGIRDTHIHCVFLVLDPLRLDSNLSSTKKTRNAMKGTSFGNGTSVLRDQGSSLTSVLDEDLDLQVLRTLQGKTTVVPVISKADTITAAHMNHLKRAVWDSLRKANLDPLEALGLDDGEEYDDSSEEEVHYARMHRKHDSKRLDERDEDNLMPPMTTRNGHSSTNGNRPEPFRLTSHLDDPSSSSDDSSRSKSRPAHSRASSSTFPPIPLASAEFNQDPNGTPYLPLSIISPDEYDPGLIGRKFPWGFADPYNPEHCDFVRLREAVFKEWRGELREASRELWYEGWRTSRLNGSGRGAGRSDAVGVGMAR
ncbi:hypothetical protein MMC26_005259 [Xylographa opegraphella]|nr:hypothetical protein [Xylographa opegraphella]